MSLKQDYQKYRWFFTSSDKLVIAGKSAEQNDQLLNQVKSLKQQLLVMHTHEPGSPFSVILSNPKTLTDKDKQAVATFTACFSQAWKQGKSTIPVDSFMSTNLSKHKLLKTGTWQVSQKLNTYKITKPALYLTKQKNRLRAIPKQALKPTQKSLAIITQGKQDKQKLLKELRDRFNNLSDEQILSALPPGGLKIS